eukprot:SAG31_NODE_2693_length_5236_cov_23.769905_1_plen_23_part_10
MHTLAIEPTKMNILDAAVKWGTT